MSGYREHSYDPNAYERPGRPLRPFNWVQWTGVGLMILGVVLALAHLAGAIGLIPQLAGKSAAPYTGLPVIGLLLIQSRREPAVDPAPELAPARKRWLIIVAVICIIVLAAAAIVDLTGA